MIYDKLPVVFLSVMASEKRGSTNKSIAFYILEHFDEVRNYGITQLADACNVSISSISRFCKEIGLADFNELRELLKTTHFNFDTSAIKQDIDTFAYSYSKDIGECLKQVANSIDYKLIDLLCEQINKYKRVSSFGLLKAASVAISLQADLLMSGKPLTTSISYIQQLEHIFTCDQDDLIIIFSYTGDYFEHQNLRANYKKLEKPTIWLITGKDKDYPSYINHVITFDSKLDKASHPYQLQFVESLIAQAYARKYK